MNGNAKVVNYSTLIKELDSGNLRPSYFFYGPEQVLIERALSKLKEAALESGSEDFNWNVYRADDSDIDWNAFADSLNSLSLIPSRQVVVLKSAGWASRVKGVTSLIENTVKQKPSDLILVLIDEAVDAKKSFYKILLEHCTSVSFPVLKPAEIQRYLVNFVAEFNKEISTPAVEKILTETDPDLRDLLSKLENLVFYIGEKKCIEPADVEECTAFTKEVEIYKLLQALGKRDETEVRLSREQLLTKRIEIGSLISMLYRQIWALYRMKYLQEQKVPFSKWRELLNIRPQFLQKRYQGYLSNYSRRELGRSLEILAQADIDRKSSAVQDDFILRTLTENLLWP